MARLHLFDMDGTLMHGSSASMELARELDLVEEIQELESALLRGTLDPPGFAERVYELWAGLTEDRLKAAFEGAPWLDGIREVWTEITERGEHCAVISLSPDFFVGRLREWGVHEARSSVFPAVPFAPEAVLDLAGILVPDSKVGIADELCALYGVERADCVAYGDSMSDAALFEMVPTAVAVNGDHHVSGLATHAYTGRDLREAFALVKQRDR
ncbi:HAD-IB family phosphatase [Streptomyces sp. H10-C2]|uniref:HAD family hydrolase n=1 Tax=unclassified Streptomyces TaxID=2593676 RepID=UPI0024BA53D4|nr:MULTISPECIES: HAD-IB family phosphatase [unclassified Streptomyces]MDJ0342034.1 HAD-IB family phosphatase [Streptomyces sp. PH10-H1]MDJ0368376.1 HAD-IB family phosphatase [Streptomyces sp. H10-C2]